jgi:biotin operon repressor
VLLKRHLLDRIARGEIDLAFRRWARPTVKTGGTLRTPAGLLEIEQVEAVAIESITEEDARRAGLALDELIGLLRQKSEGDVYRVQLGSIVPDPRVALREDDDLSDEDLAHLRARLDRLDRASEHGAWTRAILRLLDDSPHVRAKDLADGLGWDRDVFKSHVRKLKALGLTISHSPGYEVSPRGKALLDNEHDS